jgi:hypothetical protein
MRDGKKTTRVKLKRRTFLKRAVYQAPVLYVLGHLVKPSLVYADFSGGPPGPPGGTPFSSTSSTSPGSSTAPQKRRTLKF